MRGGMPSSAQNRAQVWVENLIESQRGTGSSLEFLENVKIDLFPDEVYLFTPKGDIMALPRNSTTLDFAYGVHTDVGNHAVAARVDRKLVPLRTVPPSPSTTSVPTHCSIMAHSATCPAVPSSRRHPSGEQGKSVSFAACMLVVARDGEGARKLIEITVEGAKSKASARRIAMKARTSVASSAENRFRVTFSPQCSARKARHCRRSRA